MQYPTLKYIKSGCLAVLIILSCCWHMPANAQVASQNYNNVNVDNWTDQQVMDIWQQGHQNGLTDDQIIQNAQNRGLSVSQAQKLQQRMATLQSRNATTSGTNNTATQNDTAPRALNYHPGAENAQKRQAPGELKRFGSDLFRVAGNSFEPNLKLATPVNYTLGPDDQVNVSVYGNSVVNWKLNVSPEGNINLPSGGVVNVAGKTIEQATQLISARLLSKNYAIGSGSTLKVTLGDIRSIKIIMTGEVTKPGTYTLPSLATAFNALYAAGGPGENGSYRRIEIIRNNRVVKRLDVYDFLVSGSQNGNISLQDQDVIRVPAYNTIVELRGAVKTPAIFEVVPGETLQDLVRFAGGFSNLAYRANIKVSQISDQQRRLSDVTENNYKNYIPLPGDIFTVEQITNRYENRVTVNGAVVRPGEYELQKNMTLLQLITKAAGLKEDAFTQLGTITRLNADNTTQIISFNIPDVINQRTNIILQREDVVDIKSIFDLRDRYTVSISGQVRLPGEYVYADSMKVQNLIFQAGGFAEGASHLRVEVARRIYNATPGATNSATAKVYSIDLNNDLRTSKSDFTLQPFDIVMVYPLPGFERQGTINIGGEALYPGPYAIQFKNERISDVIKRAGGLTASADADGSTLKRSYVALLGINKTKTDTVAAQRDRIAQLQLVRQGFADSAFSSQVRSNLIGINLKEILEKPGSETDLIIKDGDVITIPQQQQVVQVSGQVHLPTGVVYSAGRSFKYYIVNAGGFGTHALKRGSYVLYPNGSVRGTRKFLFFNNYPKVKPGSEIIVPQRPLRRGLSFGEFAGIVSAIGTTVILAIVSLR